MIIFVMRLLKKEEVMMMIKTPYTLSRNGSNIKVMLNDKLEAQGFTNTESALTAIHKMEGKKQGHFYVESDGIVYRQERIKLNDTI